MDWDQLLKEATQYLQEYLRIETVNPPGNEIRGSQVFQKNFRAGNLFHVMYSSPLRAGGACSPP